MKTLTHYTLEEIGLKTTKGRSMVLKYLCDESKPVDVVQIMNYLEEHNIHVNQTTVYRILEAFYDKGIVNRIEFLEGKFRYELANKSEHHHLICEKCGRVEDIEECAISGIENDIKLKNDFIIKRHMLEFFGICRVCQS